MSPLCYSKVLSLLFTGPSNVWELVLNTFYPIHWGSFSSLEKTLTDTSGFICGYAIQSHHLNTLADA